MKQFKKQDVCKAFDVTVLNRKVNHLANAKLVCIPNSNWIQNNSITLEGAGRSQQILVLPYLRY